MKALRSRLGLKLYLSYIVIIVIGGVVLILTAELLAPRALGRHLALMQSSMGDDPALAADLLTNYFAALTEILLIALFVSLAAAIAVSAFTSRRIVAPIDQMMAASRALSEGQYHLRIPVAGEDELGALAQTFNRMAESLENTEQRRLALLGDVAHELRTPLSNIRGTMEGLVDEIIPADSETFLEVQAEVSRLQRLVQDLEELSRAEAGLIKLEHQALDLGELIQRAVQRLQPQYDDQQVHLTTAIDPRLPAIEADPDRLTQVLLNLLGNALQYTPPGGSVQAAARQVQGRVVVEIIDTGIGLSRADLDSIFERFFRVDKSRSRAGGGSGIGLTIARHLIEAHGGSISAQSPGLGQGSTFRFSLPIGV